MFTVKKRKKQFFFQVFLDFPTILLYNMREDFLSWKSKKEERRKTMKKKFESVEIFITLFAQEDVIATSGGTIPGDSGENDAEWDG